MLNRIELLDRLQDKNDKKAYAFSKEIIAKSTASDAYYAYFDDFVSLMTSSSSYVRTRGFILCCAQARWDTEGKIQNALPAMMALLYDKKPTVVRQCLSALREVILFRPELSEKICEAVQKIDLSHYKDSMAPLIKKDADALLKLFD